MQTHPSLPLSYCSIFFWFLSHFLVHITHSLGASNLLTVLLKWQVLYHNTKIKAHHLFKHASRVGLAIARLPKLFFLSSTSRLPDGKFDEPDACSCQRLYNSRYRNDPVSMVAMPDINERCARHQRLLDVALTWRSNKHQIAEQQEVHFCLVVWRIWLLMNCVGRVFSCKILWCCRVKFRQAQRLESICKNQHSINFIAAFELTVCRECKSISWHFSVHQVHHGDEHDYMFVFLILLGGGGFLTRVWMQALHTSSSMLSIESRHIWQKSTKLRSHTYITSPHTHAYTWSIVHMSIVYHHIRLHY